MRENNGLIPNPSSQVKVSMWKHGQTHPIHCGPPPLPAHFRQWLGGSWTAHHLGRSSHITLVKENRVISLPSHSHLSGFSTSISSFDKGPQV